MSAVRRAAVIGSGFGGLAAAIRLQALGFATTVFEARDRPGGRAYVYEEQGHVFDAGPTVITAPDCLRELFTLAGRRMEDEIELLPVHPFYRLRWDDGDSLDYSGNVEDMERQIHRRSPDDLAGYRTFVDYSRRVFEKGYEELAGVPFLRFAEMVRVAPQLLALRADRSVYATIAKFVRDEHLRQALSFHTLLVGGNPFETSAIYSLIHFLERKWGVFFPRGGTGALVQALARTFTSLGGDLRLEDPVRSVRVTPTPAGPIHRLAARTGEHAFDLVVSNADLHHTYARLYEGVPGAESMRRRLERMQWSMSLFVLYFGTDIDYPELAHHTILFGSRYRELLDDIFHGAGLPEDFSLYLHAPTVTDPSLAPPGRGTYYVLAPVPHLGNAPLDWTAIAEGYADRILRALESVMPGLRRHLTVRRWFTPHDFRSVLNAHVGSAFSVAPTLTQSAWFRPHNRDPDIPGLYLVGAGTHPGAGLPGVINSAKATVSAVAADFERAEARRAAS
jgi:phytoene desaturase